MALSEEDKLWIEEKRKNVEREERELKRRGIIPYTEEELEEINAKKAEMREQAELTAEAIKTEAFKRGLTTTTRFNPATGLPIIGEFDTSGYAWGHGN